MSRLVKYLLACEEAHINQDKDLFAPVPDVDVSSRTDDDNCTFVKKSSGSLLVTMKNLSMSEMFRYFISLYLYFEFIYFFK